MGTRWNHLIEGVLSCTENICFEEKYEITTSQKNSTENSIFVAVKIAVYCMGVFS